MNLMMSHYLLNSEIVRRVVLLYLLLSLKRNVSQNFFLLIFLLYHEACGSVLWFLFLLFWLGS